MKIKRLISILATVAVVTTSLSAISVSAKTVTNTTTLKWDFESTNDFAPLDTSLDYWTDEQPDTIGSGAWSRQSSGAKPADNGPFQTTFDRLFNGNSGNNGPAAYINDKSGTNYTFLTRTAPENGGSYCAAINSTANGNEGGRAIAMSIMLSDTELIPGQSYKVSADLLSANASGRGVYVGLSKPSLRPKDSAYNVTNPSWLNNADMLETDKADYKADQTWREGVGYITPTADMYENGKIILYIGASDASYEHRPKNEFLYVDNVEITPQNPSAGYTALKRGRIWDFEEKNTSFVDFVGEFDGNAAKDVVNKWGAVVRGRDKSLARHPKYITVADANARLYGMWENNGLPTASENTGYAGAPAPGSNECVYVHAGDGKTKTWFNEDSNASALGMRLVLSQDEFPAGTYKLGFYGASTRNNTTAMSAVSAAETWKIAVIPTDHVGFNNMSLDKGTLSASLANAEVKIDTGVRNGSFWSYVNATITLTDACYYNGTTSIILYNAAPNGCYTSEAVYFDDISLTPVDNGSYTVPVDGSAVNGYMTTVIPSSVAAPAAYIATYAENNGDAILTDVNSYTAASGVTNYQFSIVPDSILGAPYIKSFLFSDTLKPLSNPGIIGAE